MYNNFKPLFFLLVMSMTLSKTSMAQTVENLIKIHSNSSLSAQKVVRMDDNVYTFMSFDNKDSLFIDGQLQSDLLSFINISQSTSNYTLVISKFDLNHKLVKSNAFSGINLSDEQIHIHKGKMYLFLKVNTDPSVKYNGEEIWTATQKHGWGDSWNVMVVLDADLQLLDVKGIDHYIAGFNGIAFGEDRMYLSGNFTNTTDTIETIEVDGYKIVGLGTNRGIQTTFMLTYDTHTGKIIECERFNVNHFTLFSGSKSLLVGLDGSVYQLLMTSFTYFIYEDIEFNAGKSNILLKYTRDGKVDKIINFFKDNYSFITEMKMTSTGDLILYGECQYGLGFNGVEMIKTHLPYAAVLMALDERDLSLKWYDYMAVDKEIAPGSLGIDGNDNIYTITSFHNNALFGKNKNGDYLFPGTYISKYNRDGDLLISKRLYSRFRRHYINATIKSENSLIFFKYPEALIGEFDSITNQEIKFNHLQLFEYKLDGINSSFDTHSELEKNVSIYPNPVHKDGEIKVNCNFDLFDRLYAIYDVAGHVVGQGRLEADCVVDLSVFGLKAGIYFLKLGDRETVHLKMVVVD